MTLPGRALLRWRPIPRAVSRPLSWLVVTAWLVQMGALARSAYLAPPANLAADLGRYGSAAQWKGVYYRGEKIGFSVGQTVPTADGYELQEDGRLQMVLLGSTSAARMRTTVRVDRAFAVRSFAFSLDPGTGAIEVDGAIDGTRLDLKVRTPSGQRSETRQLAEPPNLSLNLPRRLAAAGLAPGQHLTVSAFDPATLSNAPMDVVVETREVVWSMGRPVPAYRLRTSFAGLTSTSWVTDVGEVVREESPMGLIVLRETRDRATALAVPGDVQLDMLRTAAVQPTGRRIVEAANVARLRLRVDGASFDAGGLQGAGQAVSGDVFEISDRTALTPGPGDPAARNFLGPEPLIESDAPEILAEARKAAGDLKDARSIAEKLVRHVNLLLEKKPTMSLPSALEVLRTRVGDCNEHTALYVALARALGVPARVAVGVVFIHGAFYYHAWPEVYVEGPPGRGYWLAADPTLNQFPADATHVVLARGGLDKQAAIMPALGRLRINVLEVETKPGANAILVGRAAQDTRPIDIPLPSRGGDIGCWSRPPR